jgi:pimeloyl-ACP methyl ester carboxylesterase
MGYSMGGGVAMQLAIRHPEKVRKVVSISAFFAILPNTTHVTLMNKMDVIVPMVNDFLNTPSQKK